MGLCEFAFCLLIGPVLCLMWVVVEAVKARRAEDEVRKEDVRLLYDDALDEIVAGLNGTEPATIIPPAGGEEG